MLATLLFAIAVLGVALGALVLRADPKRWDNRFFFLLALADGATAAARGLLVLAGGAIDDHSMLLVGLVGATVTSYFSIEFAYAFPRNRPAPWPVRIVAAAGAVAGVVMTLKPSVTPIFFPRATLFFLPYFIGTLALLFRTYRSLGNERAFVGIPLVLAAVAFRWSVGMFCFIVAKRMGPEAFAASLQFEHTGAILVGYLFFGYAVLRHNLFSVRGVVAGIVLYAGFAVAAIGLVALGLDLLLGPAVIDAPLRAGLVALALVPVLLYAAGRRVRPRIEEAILCEIEPRRVVTKNALTRVAQASEKGADADAILALSVEALAEISAGGRVRWLAGPASAGVAPARLPPALAEHLRDAADHDPRRAQRQPVPLAQFRGLGARLSDGRNALLRARRLAVLRRSQPAYVWQLVGANSSMVG